MPENCTTTCPALDETTQGAKLTVTGNEFSPNGEDCIHGMPVGDEVSLSYPCIPVYDPPAGPLPSQINLKDWTDDNPVLVGGAFAINESPASIPNVLTNSGGSLTVSRAPVVSQPTNAVFVAQRGFIPNPGAESPYFLASEIPDYDAASFEFQGNDYEFSSLEYSALGARRIVRICDGQESCNIELVKATSSIPGERVELLDLGVDLGNAGWWGGGVGVDGKIYCMPCALADVLIIDPVAKTASRSSLGGSDSGVAYTRGAISDGNGVIYSSPARETDVCIINTNTQSISRSNMGADLSENSIKFSGGARAGNGKIYCPPDDHNRFLVIDPSNGTASKEAMGLSFGFYGGGIRGLCLAGDGNLYGVTDGLFGTIGGSGGSNQGIVIIDPSNDTATTTRMGLTSDGGTDTLLFSDVVLGADGKLYYIPFNSTTVLVVDPANSTAVRTNFGIDLSGSGKWYSGALGLDGKIYCPPYNSSDVLIIDTVNGTAERTDFDLNLSSTGGWTGAVLAGNGKIFTVPFGRRDFLVFDTN